ncbi:MAG: ribosome maturation factor RimP [Gammaproteobacteria bacterium]
MNMKQKVLTELLEPVITAMGYVFWGIEYQIRKADALLRVYIDSPEGISVDDCADVSYEISGVLDVEEPISMAYVLEVSSPGLDRILFTPQQFEQFIGEEAKINLNHKIDNRRKIKGKIITVEGDKITIESEGEQIIVDFDTIMKARIVPGF